MNSISQLFDRLQMDLLKLTYLNNYLFQLSELNFIIFCRLTKRYLMNSINQLFDLLQMGLHKLTYLNNYLFQLSELRSVIIFYSCYAIPKKCAISWIICSMLTWTLPSKMNQPCRTTKLQKTKNKLISPKSSKAFLLIELTNI